MYKNWKAKVRQKAKGSGTPGNQKSDSCRADGPTRIFAKRNRSYKIAGYEQWCNEMDKRNGKAKRV